MNLEGKKRRVENSFHSMNKVCDNNNFGNPWDIDSLVDATSNGKESSFSRGDVYHVVYHFDDRFITDMDVSNRCCHVVLDTSISNNKSVRLV